MHLTAIPTSRIIFSFIFSLLPISFILGNSAVNFNLILLIIYYFLTIKKIDITNLETIDKIIIFYFAYIVFSLAINLIENYFLNIGRNNIALLEGKFFFGKNVDLKNTNIYLLLKSIFYLRFLLLYFIVKNLVKNDLINIKIFLISCSLCCLFVSFDIFFQYYFGFDIFGIEATHPRKLSGPFGEELIAGSYIQKFSLFLFFTFIFFFSNKKNLFFLPVLFVIIFFGILLSGNRFPLILFILSLFILTIFYRKIIKIIFLYFLAVVVLFSFFDFKNDEIKNNFLNFKYQTVIIYKEVFNQNLTKSESKYQSYFDEFESFYETWKMNKYLGGGLRSFRINCPKREGAKESERLVCNTHPHNYYLEILTDLGLIGLLILCVLFSYLFINFYKNHKINKNTSNYYAFPFACTLFIEIFPLRSSGSFFTNSNAVFIFILISIISGFIKQNK